ncbi:MAG: AraC family transcriptional regulator [Lentisphaerae bacterium]|nr:MAG: AraC family transcriptional regulator [Lentisphaerota bacterium]
MTISKRDRAPEDLFSLSGQVLLGAVTRLDSTWHREGGRDGFTRLYAIERGCVELVIDGQATSLSAGEFAVIPAYRDFAYRCENEALCHWCHCVIPWREGLDLFGLIPGDYRPKLNAAEYTVYLQFLDDLIDAVQGRHVSPWRVPVRIWDFFCLYAKEISATELMRWLTGKGRFQRVLDFVHANLHRHLTLAELARRAGMERTAFAKAFRREYGVSPMRYILFQRISKAQEMIRGNRMSLQEIAAQLGFCDEFHLSRRFHDVTGLRPPEYRRRIRHASPF